MTSKSQQIYQLLLRLKKNRKAKKDILR